MISFSHISFWYPSSPKPVLRDLCLDVPSGSHTTITGPEAAGKTTLAHLAAGILKPTVGSIRGPDTPGAGVAYIGSDPSDQMVGVSVEEDIVLGLENRAIPVEMMRKRLKWVLELTGLEELRHRLTYSLSGGEQQKTAVAAALAAGCQLLILDEALTMLDRPSRRGLRIIIDGLRATEGMTILEIANTAEGILRADRVIFIDSGIVVWDGPSEDFSAGRVGREWLRAMRGLPGLCAMLSEGSDSFPPGWDRDLIEKIKS